MKIQMLLRKIDDLMFLMSVNKKFSLVQRARRVTNKETAPVQDREKDKR